MPRTACVSALAAATARRRLRVLDLATWSPGPGAARYLADFGADVLKVERPGAATAPARWACRDPRDGTSLYWKLVGRNKRCATLDLKSDDGRATRRCAWSTTPTCSSRTSGPARSSGSASAPTCCSPATPAW